MIWQTVAAEKAWGPPVVGRPLGKGVYNGIPAVLPLAGPHLR